MEREVSALTRNWRRVRRPHDGRTYIFFESGDAVCACSGIGPEPARRAAEAIIALYHPAVLHSVGFAGALDSTLKVGDIFTPEAIVDARDGSRIHLEQGSGTLLTFTHIASAAQKSKLGEAYGAHAIDMEAAAVVAAASAHGIAFVATKAISDEIEFELPGMEDFIDHNGQFRTTAFVLHTAIRPWLWSRVAKLDRNSRKAASALAKELDNLLADAERSVGTTTSGRHD